MVYNSLSPQVKYSVIIPALNEEYFIRNNLGSVKKDRNDVEVILADGGSADNTISEAEKLGIQVIHSDKGRGIQQNKGAACAKGDILFFLHADTEIPRNTFELLDDFFSSEKNKICRFKLGFDIDHQMLKIYSNFSKLDTIFTRFGDSAIIVRKDFFESIGGFNNYFIFEDVDFFRRAKKLTKIGLLNAEVKSSARKFVLNGLIINQLRSLILFKKYFFGIDTLQLWNEYFNKKKKNKNTSLIVFARYPEKGKVKTRLSKDTSDIFAARFYKECADKVITSIKKLRSFNKYIFNSEAGEKEKVRKWIGTGFFYVSQKGENLGSRMLNAFELVFSHYAEKAIIIGTDIPDLNSDIILQADMLLDNSDIVIGPSNDGGYYLLGLKKPQRELFENIEWSSDSVLNSTLKAANKLELKIVQLPVLRDIDTKQDLENWLNDDFENPLKHKIRTIMNSKL